MIPNSHLLEINVSPKSVFCFDLDDTLYKERDYLRSGFSHIAQQFDGHQWLSLLQKMLGWYDNHCDVFASLLAEFPDSGYSKEHCLNWYRFHIPDIKLDEATKKFLFSLKAYQVKTALITDGRSITQRNKLKALGLATYFDELVISEEIGSEKPSEKNFKIIEEKFGEGDYIYFGDNYKKDFVMPNKLGWLTVAISGDKCNIHVTDHKALPREYLPRFEIESLSFIQLTK